MENGKDKSNIGILLPVLFSFYVMGFVDIAGVSVSYIKQDFNLSDTVANLIPMMVFLWFAFLSIPIGQLMNRQGRKKVVLLSAIVTFVGMMLPLFSYTFPATLVAFALLGIGNTMLQVSLNPLLIDVAPSGRLTSMITLGQFIKAIASTLGPIIISLAASLFGDWKYVFPIYAVFTAVSWIWLLMKPISESSYDQGKQNVFSLFKDKNIILFFSVIFLSVGFEVGLISAVPKYLQEAFGTPIERGSYACSLYYVARTIGTFVGSIILARIPARTYQVSSLAVGLLSFAGFLLFKTEWLLFAMLFCIGFFCANIFAVTLSVAMQYKPDKANEISALMITGVAGGAILPPIMGVLADATSQAVSLLIPLLSLVYMFLMAFKYKNV